MKRPLYTLLLYLFTLTALAGPIKTPPSADHVFQLSATIKAPSTVQMTWKIAPGNYLYRDKLTFKILAPKDAKLTKINKPKGVVKVDKWFGKQHIYKQPITLQLPIQTPSKKTTRIAVAYQGCSLAGYCYPPMRRIVAVNFSNNTIHISDPDKRVISAQGKITRMLEGKHVLTILIAFFGFGLLLAFTPCVLPMIPILSGIIVGHKKNMTTKKAFCLSLIYVLSMSFTYALGGVAISYAGGGIQSLLQQPWVLILFSLLFVLLALSLFGFYDIELPKSFERRLAALSNKQEHGSYLGVAIMGILATLIISPCVTPPLVGALVFIAQSGNAVLGGSALFALGLGMGSPLLLIGTAGGKLLPKTGTWMNSIKRLFGFIMLGMAIWLLSRIIPGSASLLLWGLLLISSSIYMGVFTAKPETNWHKLWRSAGFVLLIYGALMIIGAALGNHDPFQPLQSIATKPTHETNTTFKPVNTVQDVKRAFKLAKQKNKPVLLDFTAKWCIACAIMEKSTFPNPDVQQALGKFILLRADVTEQTPEHLALSGHYSVVAPPTFLFFDPNGKELENYRIVGEMNAKQFAEHLQKVLQN